MQKKQELLHSLTGVGASKLSYYTELKEKINEIEKRNAQLEILNQVAKGINVDTTVEDMLSKVFQLLCRLIPITRLGIYLKQAKPTAAVVTISQSGKLTTESSMVIPPTAAEIIQTDCHGGVCDIHTGEAFFPLKVKGRCQGLLGVRCSRKYDMSSGDLAFLQHLTEHLGVSLENSRLYREVVFANLRWEETFKAVTEQIILVGKDFTLLRVNEATSDFYHLDRPRTGEKCYRVFWGRDEVCPECLARQVLQSGLSGQNRQEIKDCIFDLTAYPVHNDRGEIYGVIQYARDVTEKLHMEVQLLQSAKLAATGEMAAGVAHELNSPLTAILGNSQLLARELMEKDPRHELAQNIVNSGKRCKSIIQNLLTFARQDNAPRENVSLAECIDQALSLISYQMDRQGIKITKQISGQRQEIFANKQQIEQVLVNLILNARDALEGKEDGGIIIRTGIIDQDDRESVFISVSDNGCGISQQDQESIFQPFYTTKADGKGYGLGLSVSLGIIQNHSGSIEVKSRKNQGSTFKLLLPPARQEV